MTLLLYVGGALKTGILSHIYADNWVILLGISTKIIQKKAQLKLIKVIPIIRVGNDVGYTLWLVKGWTWVLTTQARFDKG